MRMLLETRFKYIWPTRCPKFTFKYRGLLGVLVWIVLSLFATAGASEDKAFKPIIPKQEAAIKKGLSWLAKNQARDGSWGSQGSSGSYRMAMTGLAGLAFLTAGHSPARGVHARTINKALQFVLKNQQRDGLITSSTEGQSMYGHGFAMTLLSQAYGMDPRGELSNKIKACLTKAVKLTARAQSSLGGWYYSPNSGSDEGSVTITQVQALRGCANVGIEVPDRVMKQALSYMHKAQNSDGGIRYSARGGGSSSPALSAAGAELLLMAGEYDSPGTKKVIEYLKRNLKVNAVRSYHRFYTSYYGAMAMLQIGGSHGHQFYTALRKDLLTSQGGNGAWSGSGSIGPAYSTAMAVTVLAIPYNYLPLYQK